MWKDSWPCGIMSVGCFTCFSFLAFCNSCILTDTPCLENLPAYPSIRGKKIQTAKDFCEQVWKQRKLACITLMFPLYGYGQLMAGFLEFDPATLLVWWRFANRVTNQNSSPTDNLEPMKGHKLFTPFSLIFPNTAGIKRGMKRGVKGEKYFLA